MIDYMTYNELYTQIGSYIQDTSSARQTQIKDALNREYAKVVKDIDWPQLMRFVSTNLPNTSTMYMPRNLDSIILISDTNRRINLEGTDTHQLYDQFAHQIGNSAVPQDYADDGDHGIKADFGTAETVEIVSASASDTTQTVRLWGTDSSGDEQTELVTLTGTTPVTSTLTYATLLRISSTDKTRVGKVSISGTTSLTAYAEILPNEVTIRYKRIRISGNSLNTIVLFYNKRVQRLTYDDDIPELPISMYLFEVVVAKMFQLQRKWQPAQFHQAEAEKLKIDILANIESSNQTSRQSRPTRNKLDNGPVIVINPGS